MKNTKFEERLEWGRFVSPLSDKNNIPFNWYSFKHRFGSELVAIMLSMFNVSIGDTVFDPFCGGGTTLIKSKLLGYNAMGLDISPFPVFLTNTLTKTYNSKKLKKTLGKISHRINSNVEIPDVGILSKSFSENTLRYIYSLRSSIDNLEPSERDFFLFSLLSILNFVSKAKKSGGFLRITNQEKVSKDVVKERFIKTSQNFIENLEHFNYSQSFAKAIVGDARDYPEEIKREEFDAILTSPPSPNRHDYTRIYELELLVGFIENSRSIKSLRYNTLRSHVEAKKKFNTTGYTKPAILKEKLSDLGNQKLNNPMVIPMIVGYFEDMYLCLRGMYKILKPEKRVGLVVSNVRFAGIMIPVDEILSEVGEQAGFKTEKIYILRYRGNSSQQMARHKKKPTRESLLVWKK